jgi:beta-lactamase regulating signal transducer with metallopeptidase domain/thiol-disulfide isomerase/thioredoxin/protocatechuate 3,4-dioxygenase beta subunit
MSPVFALNSTVVELCRTGLQLGIGLLIQSGLLLGAGLLAGRLLHTRGSAHQSLVYRATLLSVVASALLVPFLAGSFRPLWSISLPRLTGAAATRPATEIGTARPLARERVGAPAFTVKAPTFTVTGPVPPAPPRDRPGPSAAAVGPLRPSRLDALYLAVAGLWCVGSALLLAWLLVCHLWIRHLRHGGERVRDGAAVVLLPELSAALRLCPPLLLKSRQVRSPFLTGVWRPAILLPAGYESEFDGPALRAILLHELTHMARRDCAWNLLARVARALLWTQPLLWVLCRRQEHASEEVCDQTVVQGEVNPQTYAECLLRLAERLLPSRPERAAGVGVVPFRSSLGRRVERILDSSRRRSLHLALRLRVGTAVAAAGVVAMELSLVSAAPRPARAGNTRPAMNTGQTPIGVPVSGRVGMPDGQPAPDATVSWISHGDDGPVVLTSVKTDTAGRFRFEDTGRLRHKDDYPQLMAEADARGLAVQNLPEAGQPVEIALNPVTELRVTFLGPEGQPVPDLKVLPKLLTREQETIFLPQMTALRLARQTDANGTVSFVGLPRGFRLRLDVEDNRFAHLSFQTMVSLGSGPVTQAPPIHVHPGASIRGRIAFSPTGTPAAGIKVGAQGIDPEVGWGDAVTDARGEFRIAQLGAGAYNVALDLKGELARLWTARAHEGVYVHSGERLDGLDFALIHGAVITGKVAAQDSGEPIRGVQIGVYGPAHPRSGAWVQGAETGADGSYLHRVPGGRQHLYIMMAAAPSGFALPAQTSRDLTVRDGETVTVDFTLPRGARLRPVHGRVLGPDGGPAANAEVMVSSSGRFGMDTTLRTAADGSFVVNEQLLSNTLTLRARQGDLATPTGTVVTVGGPVALRLQRNVLASLSGRVIDTTGRPVAGAQITLIAWAYDTGTGCVPASVAGGTDSEGRYALPSLWPDLHYSVDATAGGFGHKGSDRIDLKPAESAELPPLVLKAADRSVGGRVVDEAGDPMVGAQVSLSGRDSAQQTEGADGEGKFRFDSVVDEKITLQSHYPGYQWARKSVAAGSTDVILVLTKENGAQSADAVGQPKEQFDALKGQLAPPLRAVAWLNSAPRTMAQLRGKVVLIDFWGIGCGPCVAALPGVQRAAEQLAAKGVVVIGLHAAGSTPAELRKFAQEHHLTYPLAIDAPDGQNLSFGKTFREYTVVGIPSVAVIDRSGRVAYLGHSLGEAVGSLSPLLARASRRGGGASG